MWKNFLSVAFALTSVALPAYADSIKLTAILAANAGVPSDAKGSCEFTFDTETRQLTYFVRYQNLTGDVTSADVHGPGRQTSNAPVIFHFEAPDSPIEGTKTLSSSQASELVNGQLYVELDTSTHAAGEIRGQIHR